jgi:adenine-specific DNA methylase
MATQVGQKQLGAFYTSSRVAQVLVDWAVRDPSDRVLDPSCGEGVFLRASAAQVSRLRGDPAGQIFGVEIDRAAYECSILPLLGELTIPPQNVVVSDFFDVPASDWPLFDAVVGNPPFIRYQTFKGPSRDKALKICKTLGVEISELASSWAPFILHATEFLAPGGQLAMVVPAEFTHATYARPVVQYLAKTFGQISLAGFAERLFPDLNQDTFLIFAEGYGGKCRGFRLERFRGIEQLARALQSGKQFGTKVKLQKLESTNGRLRNHFLPSEVGALYNFLAADSRVYRLGELAQVGIGYVTGNNRFFHLSKEEASTFRIPNRFRRPSLLRGGIIRGLSFSRKDWAEFRNHGEKSYLLSLPSVAESRLPKGVRDYLAQGKGAGVHTAYKCTVREPWYTVPYSPPALAFLTYMSGDAPRIAWNSARVLATNSIHEIRFKRHTPREPWKVAVAFWSSLSQLSCEIEGHPLGGGMLKLEPTEAERTLVVPPQLLRLTKDQFAELDALVRSKSIGYAIDLADEWVLRDTLALTWGQILVLRDGLREIRETRRKRIAAPGGN